MTAKDTAPLQSMTGYARSEGRDDSLGLEWVWDIRSVNSTKGLDIRCRLPSGMDSLEKQVREALSGCFVRGSVHVSLQIRTDIAQAAWQINEDWLQTLVEQTKHWCRRHPDALSKPTFDGLLQVKGVIEAADPVQTVEDNSEVVIACLRQALDAVVAELLLARSQEGAKLYDVVDGLIADISGLIQQAEDCSAARSDAIKARLQRQVHEMMETQSEISSDRLAQELAILATRYDIREELDRLKIHVVSARELLAQGKGIGRKFDFLCQEFNREANTLCSKSSDSKLTAVGLELKTVIDRLREQIQNIE
jgi:uncharacterized protein (TIGR00255 family)